MLRSEEAGLSKFPHLLGQMPERELAIRRLCAHVPEFRGLCDDYEEAVTAQHFWEAPAKADESKAGEFRRLAAEIEADIRRYLDGLPGRHSL